MSGCYGLPRAVVTLLRHLEPHKDCMKWRISEASHKVTLTLNWNCRRHKESLWDLLQHTLKFSKSEDAGAPCTVPSEVTKFLDQSPRQVNNRQHSPLKRQMSFGRFTPTNTPAPSVTAPPAVAHSSDKHPYMLLARLHREDIGVCLTATAGLAPVAPCLSDRPCGLVPWGLGPTLCHTISMEFALQCGLHCCALTLIVLPSSLHALSSHTAQWMNSNRPWRSLRSRLWWRTVQNLCISAPSGNEPSTSGHSVHRVKMGRYAPLWTGLTPRVKPTSLWLLVMTQFFVVWLPVKRYSAGISRLLPDTSFPYRTGAIHILTHLGLGKIATILQTTYANACLVWKSFSILFQLSLKFVPKGTIDNIYHGFR